MVVPDERVDERLLDPGQLAEGDVGLLQLAVLDLLGDHVLHENTDALAGRVLMLHQGSGRRLGGVRQHDDHHLLGLRLAAPMPVLRWIDVAVGLGGLGVEK